MSSPTPACPNGQTPPFPGLYVPHGLDQGGNYICSTYDAWFFTVLWTLIVYAAFYLAAAGYAFLVQVGASASGNADSAAPPPPPLHPIQRFTTTASTTAAAAAAAAAAPANGNEKTGAGSGVDRGVEGLVRGARRNWKVTIVVGVAYVVVGGVEAVLAGSIVGVILGTVYDAGDYRLSTWGPLVWAVINVIFLILSSFSIQERLL